jgi:hypothetical protein
MHCRGTDNHARHSLGEPGIDGSAIANAAAELDRDFYRGENALDRRRIDRLAGKGAIEIDEVEIGEALFHEGTRLRRRVAAENRGTSHVALLQTHCLAVFEINGRK